MSTRNGGPFEEAQSKSLLFMKRRSAAEELQQQQHYYKIMNFNKKNIITINNIVELVLVL